MKKKGISFLLALCMLCTLLTAPASASETNTAVQTVQALGIISGDTSGNLNLSGTVTRAQFAKMLVAASSYKDTISGDGIGYSLYKDVKSSHWASEYIRVAVQEGWMTGYIDGTFRPDQTVKLEEACAAALKLLGYDSSSLAGSFPYAQLNKAGSLGLRSQIQTKHGQAITRQDCANLFYNLLTAKTSNGQVYATTLGYTLTNGEVDYRAIALDSLSGPYIAESSTISIPFTPATIYRNGNLSTNDSIQQNDVYYYNEGLSTLWVYSDRASGKISALSPSNTAPTSVTISGKTYSIGSSNAAYQLSALNGDVTQEWVTLLLGMDGSVVGVLTGEDVDSVYYGVIESYTKSATDDDNAAVQTSVTVVCTDGIARTFSVDKDTTYTAGRLVSININSDGITVKSLSEKSTSGKVNSSATKLGDLTFAEDVEILDTNDEGAAVSVDVTDLAGLSLSSSDVRYYGLDSEGKIEYLILDDVTGNTWTYAYMADIEDLSQEMSINVNYTWIVNGNEQSLRGSTSKYAVDTGGVAIAYKSDGSIRSMKRLDSVSLSELSTTWAMVKNKKVTLSDDVQVYLRQNSSYYLTSLSAINAEDYTLTGWCDSALDHVRIIIATPKSNY